MDLIKLDMTQIWATNGDKIQPSDAKIAEGWIVESVPRQTWNWFENRQDQNIAYMLQKAIPEWDGTTEYQNNKSYVQRNGVVYKCTVTGVNLDPAAPNNTNWVKAFPEWTQALEALRNAAPVANTLPYYDTATSAKTTPLTAYARTLLATATAAAARGVLDAQQANVNLTALSALGGVNNTFPYYTGTNTFGLATVTGFARTMLGQQDAASWRATLGLKGAAIYDLTDTRYSTAPDASVVLVKGDFGLGTTDLIDLPSGTDLNNVYATGFYQTGTGNLNQPAGVTSGQMIVMTNAGNYSTQLLLPQSSSSMYHRSSTGGTWNAWVQVWNSANLVKTATSNDSTAGRLLKVGDFGIGAQGVLTGDINAITTGSGFYKLGTPYTGAPVANTPFTVIHQSYDNERTQIAILEGGASVRQFIRKYSAGAWGAWVEIYHTGNTSAIVSQVTTNIQPTLNTKVSKSGDTMTGTLVVPNIEVGVGSSQGFIDFHAANASTDYDVRLICDSPTGTSGKGRLIHYAGLSYFEGGVTVTGNLNTGAGVQIGGSLSVGSELNVAGNASMAANTIQPQNGRMLIFPADRNNANNAHCWFVNGDGSTRGILYGNSANNMAMQAGNQVCAVFYADGHTGLNNITTNNINATGQISTSSGMNANGRVSGSDVLSSGVVYSGGGQTYLATDGNINGPVFGGFMTTWINNNYLPRGDLMPNIAAQGAGGIGTYALAGGSGFNANPGDQVAGSQLRWSSVNATSSALPGSWRCMGYSNGGTSTLWLRYA